VNDGEPILEISGVHKHFGGIQAVRGASFSVPQGSITALIGPNGAGKTTLFNVVTGFYRPDSGSILYEGNSIFGHRPYKIARNGMVRTFQITKALAAMPVIDNMTLAGADQPGESLLGLIGRRGASRKREGEVHERAMDLLATFNLDDKADEYAGTLSGGQRKLLELARALMPEPRMVLLDEPMAGINPTLGAKLLEHMHDLRDNRGVTFLFIEHDMDVVMEQSDEVVVMANGETILKDRPEAVRRDQRVVDAYLGGGAGPIAEEAEELAEGRGEQP
jgi:neutral amino acid transport system ATP-binding protein